MKRMGSCTVVRYTAKTSITTAAAHPGRRAPYLFKVRSARYRPDLNAWQKNVGRAAGNPRRQPRGESDVSRSAAERFGSAHRTRQAASCGPAALLQLRRHCRHSRSGWSESDMGLITGLLTLPNAPVRGVIWVAEKLNDAAERELHAPGVHRAQPAVLNRELEDRNSSTEEFEPGRGKAAGPAACCTRRPRTERSKVTPSWMTQPR